MDFNLILVIIQLVQIVKCSLSNTTSSETCNICSLSLFRRKRANSDYTRWRANLEPTEEFIVKVLDDDVTTHRTNEIVAVNIQPVTKGAKTLIINGARVPSYTPVTFNKIAPPVKTKVQSVDRDDSPPASPQFLPRSPTELAQQYAPIAPVLFTRTSIVSPLTPAKSIFDETPHFKQKHFPTRSSPNSDEIIPLRTMDIDSLFPFEFFSEANSKTTVSTYPERTSYAAESLRKAITLNEKDHRFQNAINKESDTYVNFDDDDSEAVTTERVKPTRTSKDHSDDDLVDPFGLHRTKLGTGKEATRITSQTYEFNNDTCVTKKEIEQTQKDSLKDEINKRRYSACSFLKNRDINMNIQRTLHEIIVQLKQWAENSPVAKWIDITNGNLTTMENPIYMMIVDDPSRGQMVSAKETVMIVAGIQGKDHHAVAAAMYLLYQLIERSESHSELLTKYRFWIIPVFNPDGYDYSMTFPRRRDWLKNLRQIWNPCTSGDSCELCEKYGIRCTIQPCYGVNLDRNFEYQWIPSEQLRSEHPCGGLYAGPHQLSEIETNAFTQFLHDQKVPFHTFIVYKEGDVLGVMYPYSHTKKKRPLDHIYRQRALRAAHAASSISGRPYVAGQISEFLPLYAGGIDDWVDGHLGIDNTYTIMIFRPTDSRDSKIIMERVVHEAYAATHALLLQYTEPVSPPLVLVTRGNAATVLISPPLLLIVMLGYG